MSSPLSMLKKTRRTPLQDPLQEPGGSQKVPFRKTLLKEFQAELASADEISPNPVSTSKSKAPLHKGAPPSDFELMSIMMQKIDLLKKTVRSQAEEIKRKDKTISTLEEKLRPLKGSESTRDLSGRDDLERRCQQLQKQVWEMENFLNDYGLIWVGDGESSDSAASDHPQSAGGGLWQPDASVARSFHMNFDLVLRGIRELNILAGEECFVRPTATGAQLAKKDPIQLSLYSNGIVMFDGPFRSYREDSTQRCMQDLMDGYFPSELQERFPDGVPFKVHDRRDEEFILRQPWDRFLGGGQAVGGQRDATSTGKKLSTDQFLSRLPKKVVKAGRVIDIRDSVRDVLQGSSGAQSNDSVILIDTPALQAMKDRLQTLSPDRPASARDVITLKVKSEDGNHTFILKMCLLETIGHLRQHLDTHRGDRLPGYDIISAYPQCCCIDDCQTLQSCGLTTNATLLLRTRKHTDSLTQVNKINS